MYISILAVVQKGPALSSDKCSEFPKKKFLKPIFQNEGHLHSNYIFYLLTAYRKCTLFQFLGCSIQVYFPIITMVKSGGLISWKIGDVFLNNLQA